MLVSNHTRVRANFEFEQFLISQQKLILESVLKIT